MAAFVSVAWATWGRSELRWLHHEVADRMVQPRAADGVTIL
jgi:hypothetical protein